MKQYLMSLQDVEKLASKKGVVLQTIKEVLQSLVDDGMVHQDKIGSSNYFW
jgi:DNA-binding transcriptional regulator YhcF (GntR family)